ncbi:MAG: twin-arginine translocase TatA/TatE family subunit [bacterium]
MISPPGPWEMMVILLLLVVVFGAKRLPEIGKGMGKGIREFKKSLREISSSDDESDEKPSIDEQPH